MRPACGTSRGSGSPRADSEHAGSPTVPEAAMRCAAASASGDVNQTVVGAELLGTVEGGVGAGVEDGAETVGVRRGTTVAVCTGDRTGVRDGVGSGAVRRGVGDDTAWPPGCVVATGGRELDGCVGTGRDVLEVRGEAVREGDAVSEGGVSVGRDRPDEALGDGREVPSSEAVSAQTPRPPAVRTAAAPTIHGALREGRRWRLMSLTVGPPAGLLKRWGAFRTLAACGYAPP